MEMVFVVFVCFRPFCSSIPDLFPISWVSDISVICLFIVSVYPYSRDLTLLLWSFPIDMMHTLSLAVYMSSEKKIFSAWSEPWDLLPSHTRLRVPAGGTSIGCVLATEGTTRQLRSRGGSIKGDSWYQGVLCVVPRDGSKENKLNSTGRGTWQEPCPV